MLCRAPLLPLLIASWAVKPRGRPWDLLRPRPHDPHVFMPKLLRAVTLRESQPSARAAADPLVRRGAIMAGPAYGPVPSRAWAGRMAWPRALA